MNDAILVQKVHGRDDLTEDAARLHLAHALPLVEVVVELATARILHHQDDLLGAFVDYFYTREIFFLKHCNNGKTTKN